MQSLRRTSISEIKAVPGLFISDRFAARSVSLLRSLNITHILSVTQPEDIPKFNTAASDSNQDGDFKVEISMKALNIDDDPMEDIVCHLKDICDWIAKALNEEKNSVENSPERRNGVLVHCTQGISRSGAVVVAYLMRSLLLEYSEALALAREYRPLISPNEGFEYQLRVWQHCEYDPYFPNYVEKPAYKALKARRDALVGKGAEAVNRVRYASMANLAASFGKRRAKEGLISEEREEKEVSSSSGPLKGKAWENVEKMEKEWNRRLMSGDLPPWQEKKKNEIGEGSKLEDDRVGKSG
ncbi:protein-tyrosine phosphatase-like protein [Tricladium varicosporioides]|nr:protein-tyrosine phosphatase-like protein [Hymenoscyphus varicosporioides]